MYQIRSLQILIINQSTTSLCYTGVAQEYILYFPSSFCKLKQNTRERECAHVPLAHSRMFTLTSFFTPVREVPDKKERAFVCGNEASRENTAPRVITPLTLRGPSISTRYPRSAKSPFSLPTHIRARARARTADEDDDASSSSSRAHGRALFALVSKS